jgi:hypothetical protein
MAKDKGNVIDFHKEAAKRGKTLPSKARSSVTQTITRGDNNLQIAGNSNTINVAAKANPKIIIQPSITSIAGTPLLKSAIQQRFNKLGEEREKRFGTNAYPTMYRKFKSDFNIKNLPWTTVWDWPAECADGIIKYLEEKYANTIQGRIENASKKEGYLASRPQLFKQERELLTILGLTQQSPIVGKMLWDVFSVLSHTELTHVQLWQLVCCLQGLVNRTRENEAGNS